MPGMRAIAWSSRPAMTAETAAGIVKHSLVIAGHRTSISLEDAFWQGLRRLAAGQGRKVADLVTQIDAARGTANLSSAIRVHVLQAATGIATEATGIATKAIKA